MNAKEIIEWVKSQNIKPSSDEAICNFVWLCEEISVKTKTVIKTLLWSGMKNLPLPFIYSIQRIP